MTTPDKPTDADQSADFAETTNGNDAPASQKQLSRVERLKKKVEKLRGKNPDIYPMW